MPARSSSISARIIAPAALALCAVAVLIVIGGSLGGGDSSDSGTPADTATQQATDSTATTGKRQPATYTVKSGDTLGAIAESTGVPVDTLQELNPELDPQALIAGQMIQLR
jgi:LysM repeat protein